MPIEDNLENLHDDENEVIVNENENNEEDEDNEIVDPAPLDSDPEPTDDPEPELSGMERFLSNYGIVGGMITFEDGKEEHFDALDDNEKYNVIASLVETNSIPIEQKYGLEPEEIQLLNYFRTQELPINEALDNLLAQRIEQINLLQATTSTDYAEMPAEAIFMKWLKENDPEASEEDLQEDLEKAKALKSFDRTVESIKKGFIEKQEQAAFQAQEQARLSQLAELESDRKQIVEKVSSLDSVAGFSLSDEEKNEVLAGILEVNEVGDSLFMEKVFSDPVELFKAAWLYAKGEKMFDEMSDYYKKEISKSYKKGKEDAINGMPGKPIKLDGGNKNNNNNNKNTIARRDEVNAKTQDELFEDD